MHVHVSLEYKSILSNSVTLTSSFTLNKYSSIESQSNRHLFMIFIEQTPTVCRCQWISKPFICQQLLCAEQRILCCEESHKRVSYSPYQCNLLLTRQNTVQLIRVNSRSLIIKRYIPVTLPRRSLPRWVKRQVRCTACSMGGYLLVRLTAGDGR